MTKETLKKNNITYNLYSKTQYKGIEHLSLLGTVKNLQDIEKYLPIDLGAEYVIIESIDTI